MPYWTKDDVMFGFQSSPGRKAGRFMCEAVRLVALITFQSSPGRKPGASPGASLHQKLIRRHIRFQSSPGRKAGRFDQPGS